MLRSLTIGWIIHLLAEAYRMNVVSLGLGHDHVELGRCNIVDNVCFCLGVGLMPPCLSRVRQHDP